MATLSDFDESFLDAGQENIDNQEAENDSESNANMDGIGNE